MSGKIVQDGITVDDALFFNEQASAQADIAGKGQIWVKNTTPNELWFTDDAGNDIQLGTGGGGFSSKARAYLSSNQSIPSGTDTKVLFDTETFDVDGEYDNTTNYRFTATNAGYYLITSKIMFINKQSGKIYVNRIYVNGSTCYEQHVISEGTVINYGHSVTLPEIVYLAAGDYVEIFAYQNTGSAVNLSGEIDHTSFAIHRLS